MNDDDCKGGEIAVRSDDIQKLRKYKDRIKEQYKTKLNIPDNDKGYDGNAWVLLNGPSTELQDAKVFIKAICNPEEIEIVDSEKFPLFIFTALQGFWLAGLERTFSVVIEPKHSRNNFKVKGQRDDVKLMVNAIKTAQQLTDKDSGIEDKFKEIVGDCVDPVETELLGLNIGVKKLLMSIVDDQRLGFDYENIRDKNIDQILEEKEALPTPRKINKFFGSEMGEASTSKVGGEKMEEGEKPTAKKTILGGVFGDAPSDVESLEERMAFMKTPQADFLRREFKQYNFNDDDVETTLLKHGSQFTFRKIYGDLQTLQEERKKKMRSSSPSRDVEMISISSDDDIGDETTCDDDVIFVKETPASQQARDVEFVCYLPGFPVRADVISWFKSEYQVTNHKNDSVPKLDILTNFRLHFNLKSHHKLNDNLFNCLGIFIVGDPAYGEVKTRGKAGRRCYVCIKPTRGSVAPSSGGENSNPASSQNSAASSSGGENSFSSGILTEWINTKSNVPSTTMTSSNKEKTTPNNIMTSSHCDVTSATKTYEGILKPPFMMSGHYNQGKEIPKKPSKSLQAGDRLNDSPKNNVTNYNSYSGHTPVTIPDRPYNNMPPLHGSHNSYPSHTSVTFPAQVPSSDHCHPTSNSYNPHSGHKPVTTPVVSSRTISKMSNAELLRLPPHGGDEGLRSIVIDGSNVAVHHGNGKCYSVRGIAICVNYFWSRGHRDIICFIPNFRKGLTGNPPTRDRDLIFKMEDMGIVKITPSRVVGGRPIVCYDDRFILRLAEENDGVIVSNDQYRDLAAEKGQWARVIKTRLLQFTFVGDLFMPPDDPMGRHGPTLDELLRETPRRVAPAHTSTSSIVTSSKHRLRQDRITMQPNAGKNVSNSRREDIIDPMLFAVQRNEMEQDLLVMFPGKGNEIQRLLNDHKGVWDLTVLVNLLLEGS